MTYGSNNSAPNRIVEFYKYEYQDDGKWHLLADDGTAPESQFPDGTNFEAQKWFYKLDGIYYECEEDHDKYVSGGGGGYA